MGKNSTHFYTNLNTKICSNIRVQGIESNTYMYLKNQNVWQDFVCPSFFGSERSDTHACELSVHYSSNKVENLTALRFADHCGNCSVSMGTRPCEYADTLTNCFLNKESTKWILQWRFGHLPSFTHHNTFLSEWVWETEDPNNFICNPLHTWAHTHTHTHTHKTWP